MTTPTLPQHDSPEQLAARERALAWARTLYTWTHSHTYTLADGSTLVLEPIAVLEVDDQHPMPESQGLDLVQILELLDVGLGLLSNTIVDVTNLLDVGAVELDPPPPASFSVDPQAGAAARPHPGARLREGLAHAAANVRGAVSELEAKAREGREIAQALGKARDLAKTLHEHRASLEALGEEIQSAIESGQSKRDGANARFARTLGDLFKGAIEALLEAALAEAGLYGRPGSITDYARQFQTITVPNVMSTTLSDACFARMRIAGPNPLLLKKIDALPANFPVDAERFAALTGQTLERALASARVYLVDYAALDVIVPGTDPAGQKYLSVGLALFALGEDRRALQPVAIQCGQTPGNSTPIFYADDGDSWERAKIQIQCADGNYHELISHLGLTHLLIEPFAVATHRDLAQTHPLFLLLLPHLQGTLWINQAAITSLIQPGGNVDRLLAGTIESDWVATANALTGLDFNAHMLPRDLAARGVDDPTLLPDYPYRDDAVLLWRAIERWVEDYLSIYYNADADVAADLELQAWYRDLVSPEGGCVRGLGEPGPDGSIGLWTFAYLAQVATMVIFTASVQHAAVNFPQNEIMSYTPAMPLATYAPAPTRVSGPLSPDTDLAELPPLQMSYVQLLVGQLLGGVYFTRLGDYDRHQREPWFADPRVQPAQEAFAANLREIERTIGDHNLARPCYEFLLPSRIPQSINI